MRQLYLNLKRILLSLSDAVHTRVEVHKMDSEMCGLVE